MLRTRAQSLLLPGVLCLVGCARPAPSGPDMPEFDYQAAATAAMSEYDKDRNGSVSKEEAKQSPALTEAFKHFDKDSDGSISTEELGGRLKYYKDVGLALYGWSCEVRLDGRPLSGATVTLVPEPFMKSVAQSATGVTDASGVAMPSVSDNDPRGVGFGLYRIELSKKDASGHELVPPEFNKQTRLGQELAPDNRSAETRRRLEIASR
jgi:EF hand domain-containing protein